MTSGRRCSSPGGASPNSDATIRRRFENASASSPAQLPDYRGLKGDPSDNLPGIPGVGEKTASKLLAAAGSLDALIADPDLAGNPKLARLIEEYGQQACLCRAVSVVRRDLPLSVDWDRSRYEAPDDATLYPLFRELEFKTLLAKLSAPPDLPLFEAVTKLTGNYRSYVHGADPPEFAALARELEGYASAQSVAFALLGDALGHLEHGRGKEWLSPRARSRTPPCAMPWRESSLRRGVAAATTSSG